jgi:hypothetical protein
MAKVIYKSGNYVVVTDANNVDRVFPIGKTVYEETAGNFLISEGQVEREQLIIPVSDTVNWVDNDGTNYTEATFRDFLRTNTGFSPASGGSGATWGGITGTLSTQTDLQSELDDKQDTLVSATNIKTINGSSVLGSGDLAISGGGGGAHILTEPIAGRSYHATVTAVASYTTAMTVAQAINLIPLIPANTLQIGSMSVRTNSNTAGSNIRFLIYSNTNGSPDLKLFESADISTASSGLKTYSFNYTFDAGTTYWFGVQTSHNINFVCHAASQLLPLTQANNYAGCISVQVNSYPFGSAPTNISGTVPTTAPPFSISLNAI